MALWNDPGSGPKVCKSTPEQEAEVLVKMLQKKSWRDWSYYSRRKRVVHMGSPTVRYGAGGIMLWGRSAALCGNIEAAKLCKLLVSSIHLLHV